MCFENVFCFFENVLHMFSNVCFENIFLKNMHSASNFANDFHMDEKVICNDEAIIQKPFPRATELAQFGLDWTSNTEVLPCQTKQLWLKLELPFDMEILRLLRFVSSKTISIKTTTYRYFTTAMA